MVEVYISLIYTPYNSLISEPFLPIMMTSGVPSTSLWSTG